MNEDPTLDVFVVSSDVLQSGESNGFGADEASNSFGVLAEVHHPTLTQHNLVDISVHLSVDEGDVV